MVVVDYQVPGLVIQLLRSLEAPLTEFAFARVIVVENSGAGAAQQVDEAITAGGWQGWASVMTPEQNLGFAGGNNLAIRAALASEDPPGFVMLLNPDTLVTPGAIAMLVRVLEEQPRVGIVGSRLEFPDGSPQGSPFRFPGIATEIDRGFQFGPVTWLLRRWSICPAKPAAAGPVNWVAGAAMIIRREVIASIGLLDEQFFAYFEDVDYCLRAQRGGWSVWYVPESRVVHLEGQSSGLSGAAPGCPPDYWFEARRLYFVKNYGRIRAAMIDAAFLASGAVGQVRCRLQGKALPHNPQALAAARRFAAFRPPGGSGTAAAAMRAGAWSALGFGGSQVLRLLFNLLATRLLFPELFGVVAIAHVVVLGLGLSFDLGTGLSIIREEEGDDARFLRTAWTLQVMRGFGLWAMSGLVAWPLASFYGEPRLLWLIPLLGSGAVLAGWQSTWLFTSLRKMSLRPVVMVDLASQLAGGVTMVLWAWLSPGLGALVAGSLIAPLVKLILSHWHSSWTDRLAWHGDVVRRLFVFGRWVWAGSLIYFFSSQVDRLLLGKLVPMELLGVYGIASALAELPRGFALALAGNVLYPAYSRLLAEAGDRLHAAMERSRRPVLWVMVLLIVAGTAVGDLALRLAFDARYHAAAWMLPLLILGVWPAALVQSSGPALLAAGKPKYSVYANAAKFAFTLMALPLGFHWAGLPGAVMAVALNDIPSYAVTCYGLQREQLWTAGQDLRATLLLLGLVAAGLAIRFLLGGGFPWEGVL